MQRPAQIRKPFFNSLAKGDDIGIGPRYIDRDKLPQAFLALGNPDLKTFLEFSKLWLRIKKETGISIPIVLAGGIGRGTIPLIRKILEHYKATGQFANGEFDWLTQARVDVIAFLKLTPEERGKSPITINSSSVCRLAS